MTECTTNENRLFTEAEEDEMMQKVRAELRRYKRQLPAWHGKNKSPYTNSNFGRGM